MQFEYFVNVTLTDSVWKWANEIEVPIQQWYNGSLGADGEPESDASLGCATASKSGLRAVSCDNPQRVMCQTKDNCA